MRSYPHLAGAKHHPPRHLVSRGKIKGDKVKCDELSQDTGASDHSNYLQFCAINGLSQLVITAIALLSLFVCGVRNCALF